MPCCSSNQYKVELAKAQSASRNEQRNPHSQEPSEPFMPDDSSNTGDTSTYSVIGASEVPAADQLREHAKVTPSYSELYLIYSFGTRNRLLQPSRAKTSPSPARHFSSSNSTLCEGCAGVTSRSSNLSLAASSGTLRVVNLDRRFSRPKVGADMCFSRRGLLMAGQTTASSRRSCPRRRSRRWRHSFLRTSTTCLLRFLLG